MNIRILSKHKLLLTFVILAFGIIYCLISLVNHYQFRTFALDLGMYNHALYSFAHFQDARFTLDLTGSELSFFATHFSPIIILYIPFYYFFGSYALLIIQIICILCGGLGIYQYAKHHGLGGNASLIIMVYFFGIWGIYSALSFDFHNNVIGAMLVPWFLLYFEKANRKLAVLFFILILIAQENMALWMVFIMAGLIIRSLIIKRDDVKFGLVLLVAATGYFILVFEVILPSFMPEDSLGQLVRYSHMGDSLAEVVTYIFKEPLDVFRMLFSNTLGDDLYSGIKAELYLMIFFSGGIALIYRPWYLIMLMPIFAQKLLTDEYGFWGINYQYSIEFAPILTIALIETILKIRKKRTVIILVSAIAIFTHLATFLVTENRRSLWYKRENARYLGREHYNPGINTGKIYDALELIPDNAIISVGSELAPHLAFRKKIYHFPVVKDAEYIAVFSSGRSTYPLEKEEFDKKLQDFRTSTEYEIIWDLDDILILKRR